MDQNETKAELPVLEYATPSVKTNWFSHLIRFAIGNLLGLGALIFLLIGFGAKSRDEKGNGVAILVIHLSIGWLALIEKMTRAYGLGFLFAIPLGYLIAIIFFKP